jgi:hypothetical protein
MRYNKFFYSSFYFGILGFLPLISNAQVLKSKPQNHVAQNHVIGDSSKVWLNPTHIVLSQADMKRLPVRGVNALMSLQAGVVSTERSSEFHVLGGRAGEVAYFVDGVRTTDLNVAQSAVESLEMQLGGLSAQYSDAMSGVVNLRTLSGSNRFTASFEGLTSKFLDAYGFNQLEGALSGPIVKDKIHFALSGRLNQMADSNPNWKGFYALPEATLNDLEKAPQIVQGKDYYSGKAVTFNIPNNIPLGSFLKSDSNGYIVVQSGSVYFVDSSGKEYPVPINGNASVALQSYLPISTKGEFLPASYYEYRKASRDNVKNLNLRGNLSFNMSPNTNLRIGYSTTSQSQAGAGADVGNYHQFLQTDTQNQQQFATWTQRLSSRTSYQLQLTREDRKAWTYRPEFGRDLSQVIFYTDVDHPANAINNNYRGLFYQNSKLVLTAPGGYSSYRDGGSVPNNIYGFYKQAAALSGAYNKSHNETWRFAASAQSQIGAHHLGFGFDYEQQTNRAFSITDLGYFSQIYADGSIENTSVGHTISSYNDLTFQDLDRRVSYYGYSMNGLLETNDESLSGLVQQTNTNSAPYRPLYYGGYIQDHFEQNDLSLDLGLRLDIFDNNNAWVLKDRFSLVDIERAGTYTASGYQKPLNVGDDWALLFNYANPDRGVAGFRDLTGKLYLANGQLTTYENLPPGAKTHRVGTQSSLAQSFNANVFKSYTPTPMLMPRIGVEYRVANRTIIFARYGVTSQRPSSNYQSLYDLYRLARDNSGNLTQNADLKPAKTFEYRMGLQQMLGESAALRVTGIYKRQTDLVGQSIQSSIFPWPSNVVSLNDEHALYKGVMLELNTKRVNGLQINANYTIAYITGNYTADLVYIYNLGGRPSFNKALVNDRLYFDQRHNFNIVLDQRFEKGKAPHFLENVGVNLIFVYKSGNPYTSRTRGYNATSPGLEVIGFLTGGVNNAEAPSTYRVDMKIEKTIPFGKFGGATAFFEIQNLLNRANLVSVFAATAKADNDGYLNQADGMAQFPKDTTRYDLYNLMVNNGRNNYGMPRLIRAGLRWAF